MDTALPASGPISLDIVSDVVCPWCFLGKRRLERALALAPDVAVTLRWRPFRLDPTIPEGGVDRRRYLEEKFGSAAAVEPIHRRLVEYGRQEGIDFQFEKITRSPNTIDAHRVIRWSEAAGLQDEIVERFFAAYFTEGADIGEPAVLAALAGEVGLDGHTIAARLASDEDRAAIEAEITEAYRIGVDGVPCFILDRRYAVMGAQAGEMLAEALKQVVAKRISAGAPA